MRAAAADHELVDLMEMRAAVLEEVNGMIGVVDVQLAAPHAGEVLVRICASGLCRSDLSTVTGKIPSRLPAVLGHEGAGVVEAVGPGVGGLVPGQHVALSWAPYCGRCENCLRELPHLCTSAWPAMFAGGLLDGTTRLSRDGEPLYHYSLVSSFAERAVVPAASCIAIPHDVPFPIAALVGCAVTTGICAAWRTARVAPGDRVAVYGCGGVGLSAILGAAAAGAAPIIAVDSQPGRLEAALALGATDAILSGGEPDAIAQQVVTASGGGVDYAFEATGNPEVMQAAFLSTRARGAAVLIGIPSPTDELRVPAISIPRGERRILGSLYGSARPDRDFPLILDLYRRGRLPLDGLVSHRLTLDEIELGFDLLKTGQGLRAIVEPR
jgi:S-(hydroxymethyl)glutathione dehydrogenase / alcohol dehydrogenase